MQPTDDSVLLRQFAGSQSNEAFAALVERYIGLVYSVALRQVGNPHSAEEITQAVFIILAQKAAQLSHDRALSSWLFQTTRLTSNNFIRGELRRTRREQEAYMQSVLNEPSHEVWPEIEPLLDDAVGDLRHKDRQAILLRFFEGRNLREVGEVLGTSEDAAEKRVTRALEKLRKSFAKSGVGSTSAALSLAISANSVHAAPALLAKTVTATAVAHGATASLSTLTLIKGTLKLMAWSKTKITIVTGVCLLLAGGAATVAVKSINSSRSIAALAAMQGSWEGPLVIDKAQLRLVLKIFNTNGAYHATFDSIDQGAKDIPVASLMAGSKTLTAKMPALDADFQGTLNADSTELSGTWKQLNRSLPLKLTRTANPDQSVQAMAADEYARRPDSDLQGAWQGSLKVGNAELRLNLRIAEPTAGTFHAQMDSVDQAANNMPVTTMSYDKPAVHFEMTSIKAVYDGTVNGRDDQITGTWVQAGKKFPLAFSRFQTNDLAGPDAQKDYGNSASYEVQGHWKGVIKVGSTTLHVVFHIAVLADGSYSATMDSPDQGASALPATTAQFNYPNLRLEWKAFASVYTGKLDSSGRIVGTWKQGKVSLPLNLERAPAN
jgi:RNA polymerase sigma factor (sigma-70 family)